MPLDDEAKEYGFRSDAHYKRALSLKLDFDAFRNLMGPMDLPLEAVATIFLALEVRCSAHDIADDINAIVKVIERNFRT